MDFNPSLLISAENSEKKQTSALKLNACFPHSILQWQLRTQLMFPRRLGDHLHWRTLFLINDGFLLIIHLKYVYIGVVSQEN